MTINNRKSFRSKKIIGMQVKNSEEQNLGNIEEIVIDIKSGSVVYAVLSFDGFFGFSEKFFAIPWREFALEHAEGEAFLILDTDRDKLSVMAGFNKEDWPDRANSDWDAELEQHYQSDDQW